MKWYEEEIEKTREQLQSRWKWDGETKVKIKREPYVFDFEETEDSIDEKSIEDFAKILFDWKKKGKTPVSIKLNDKDMVLYSTRCTNGMHSEHYLMTLNGYAFWRAEGMFDTFSTVSEHPRGKGFWKINNNEQRLRVSKDVLMYFSRGRKNALENGDTSYLHDDHCNFKDWIEERKFWSKT